VKAPKVDISMAPGRSLAETGVNRRSEQPSGRLNNIMKPYFRGCSGVMKETSRGSIQDDDSFHGSKWGG